MLNNGINHFWRTVAPLRMRTLNVVKTDSILTDPKSSQSVRGALSRLVHFRDSSE